MDTGKALANVKAYGSLLIGVGILAVVVGNLAATSRVRATLDKILEYGVVEPTPQLSVTEWVDRRGLIHRITTSRRLGESDIELELRHADAVETFIKTFKPREQ